MSPRAKATEPKEAAEAAPEATEPEPPVPANVEAVVATVHRGFPPAEPEQAAELPEPDPNEAAPEPAPPAEATDGLVTVKVLADAFPYRDSVNGTYRVAKRGGEAKVTAAQADRGEALGAVERV